MTGREKALENYEQALFTLLLSEVAEREGNRLLEEQAQLSDEDVPIGEDAYERCRQVIAKHQRQEKRRSAGRRVGRGLAKAAIAALVAVLLFTTALATIEPFRIKTYNLVIDLFDDHMSIGVAEKEEGTEEERVALWVPEGFTLVERRDNSLGIREFYQDAAGNMLSFWTADIANIGYEVNTEGAVVEEITIGDLSGMKICRNAITTVILFDYEHGFLVNARGENVSEEVVLRAAEQMQIPAILYERRAEHLREEAERDARVPQLTTGWVPAGFIMEDDDNSSVSAWNHFTNDKGNVLAVVVTEADEEALRLETETSTTEAITIHGQKGKLITDGVTMTVVWPWAEDGDWIITVGANGLREADLMKVAESVEVTKKAPLPPQPTPAPILAANWIPEGFTLDHEGANIMTAWVQYMNAEEDIISVFAAELTTGNMTFDTEDAEVSHISLHGTEAQLIVGEEVVQVIWPWETDPTWLLSVTAQGLDADTAVKIAENVSATR